MRIYEGSPRQDFEEVFRSIGAFLDTRGTRDILLLEVPDGFIVQGLVAAGADSGAWSESVGSILKETLTFLDDDIAKFMEEAAARRGEAAAALDAHAGPYEQALRVIGRWMDGAEAEGHLPARAGWCVRDPAPGRRTRRGPPPDRGVHARGCRRPRRAGAHPSGARVGHRRASRRVTVRGTPGTIMAFRRSEGGPTR